MFDEFPKDMLKYLQNYGFHFNRKALEYALSHLKIKPAEQITKQQLDNILSKSNTQLEEGILYDGVYVANIFKLLHSSNLDDVVLASIVKKYLSLGNVFCKWYSSLIHEGIPIDWEELL